MSRATSMTSRVGLQVASPAAVAALTFKADGGGLVIGRDRRQLPVVVRAFRQRPTRMVLVGGIAMAQLFTLRALALGTQVLVQTLRPAKWSYFGRQVVAGPGAITVAAPGGVPAVAATASRPHLLIVDAGPVDLHSVPLTGEWQTALVVRDELTSWDIDSLGAADLTVMQRLTDVEAALAAAALRLNQAQDWLPRIGPEMVAVAEPGRLRWALLSPTSVERQLFASVARFP